MVGQNPKKGGNVVKKARDVKVKVFFSRTAYDTCVIFMLVYNFKFCILSTPFNITS